MALYSLNTSAISRKAGRSAVAAAAYRAGVELVDQRTGLVHDYTRKRGVEHVELMAPEGIQLDDADALWNAAEAAEKRKDGRAAREILVALPSELDADQRTALARQMTADLVERYGVAAQLCIHAPDSKGDERNHHAHILITTRRWNHDGPGNKAQMEWSATQCKKYGVAKPGDEVTALRERWSDMQNAALERAGVDARVDHRSLAAQGIDRVPQIHVGNHGTDMIRKGTPEQSERASLNLEIISTNNEVFELREQLQKEQQQEAEAEAQRQAEMDAQGEAEWQEWISRPDVDPASGRIITELGVSACIERESQYPENQPSPLPEGRVVPWPPDHDPELEMLKRAAAKQRAAQLAQKPSPTPPLREPEKPPQAAPQRATAPVERKPEPTPQAPAESFDAKGRALEIVRMETADERHAAMRDAAQLDLDAFDSLSIELEPLMDGLTGELTAEGQRLRDGLLPPETPNSQRAERVQREQDWEPPGSPGGPGF